jgi:hypothetical protein
LYNPDFADHSQVGWNYRDCATMNAYVEALEQQGQPVASVIAAFAEGEPIGPDSWLFDEAAVVICVRDPQCIKIKKHYIIEANPPK